MSERLWYFHLQVYGERYVDQMGIIGYFPATVVKETQKFAENTVNITTTVSIFVSFIGQYLRFIIDSFSVVVNSNLN